jgi:two-component system nitrate/nitrite response regulator NarL
MAHALPQPSYSIKPRVVIVDDELRFRDAARMLLAARGYEVVGEAWCAASAMDAVERHAPEAVLLDVRLGDDDGFALCASLTRSRPDLAVLLTSADEQDAKRATRCGARGFVRKSRLIGIDLGEFWPPE